MGASAHASTRRLRALRIAVACVVALSLTASTAAWGSVCIGDDGHVALEVVAATGCLGSELASQRAALPSQALGLEAPNADSPCCGPCIDLGEPGTGLASIAPPDVDPTEASSDPAMGGRVRPIAGRRPTRPVATPDPTRELARRLIATVVIVR